MAKELFQELYFDNSSRSLLVTNRSFPLLSWEMMATLIMCPLEEEIKKALWPMHPNKALGPNDYWLLFIKIAEQLLRIL